MTDRARSILVKFASFVFKARQFFYDRKLKIEFKKKKSAKKKAQKNFFPPG